jgi:glucose/mannose-6-phosphate isomerase
VREAATAPCQKVAMTRGGALAREAGTSGIPTLWYSCDGEPRSALGYGALTLLGLLTTLGVVEMSDDEVAEAIDELEVACRDFNAHDPARENRAQALAREIRGSVPVIFADASLAPAATRWQTQFNENAKCWAFSAALPEILHNAVEGIGRYATAPGSAPFFVVLLEDSARPAAARARIEALQEHLFDCGVPCTRLRFSGSSLLSSLLQACMLGDWVSYYLAVEAGIDPSPVPTITRMKRRVAQLLSGTAAR